MAPRGWGFWTEAKLDILSAYLPAFATASKRAGELVYLDLFAGNTSNERRDVGRDIKGSSIRALEALPPTAHIYLFELPLIADELDRSLRALFPGRRFDVVPGDCNVAIADVLRRLADLNLAWAPTFAFVDPYSSAALRWDTIATLADFKRGRPNKVEQWLLFYGSDIPRVLGQSPENANRLRGTFGGDRWVPIAEAREQGALSAAGNRIMGDVYGKAALRFEKMRHEAIERRRADRSGQPSFFSAEELGVMDASGVPSYEADDPSPPYGTEWMED